MTPVRPTWRALGALLLVGLGLVAAPTSGPTAAAPAVGSLGPTGVPSPLPAVATGSTPIGCSHAAERVQITVSSHLDPACTWTGGFDVTQSDVVLDCRGATVQGTDGTGIEVRTPTAVELHDVTVRNCRVSGFLNSLRVTREGFRTLAAGVEFEHATSRIRVEHNEFGGSRGVGVYVDGYVSDVTIAGNDVVGAGSSGIYLETGSEGSTVTGNRILGNGFRENGPGGQTFTIGGTTLWFWGVGREGISVDGSFENTIEGNHLEGNANGGVLLYENCGEYPDRNPGRYFERRYPADRNRIEGNAFVGERNGVWVGSRMAENTLPMECSDPAYIDEPGRRVVLDHAEDNDVIGNTFTDVHYGVRVEDDGTEVRGNTFAASSPDHHAVVVGTPLRTEVLDRPVVGTVLADNTSTITSNPDPYRWIHGEDETEVSGNTALGVPTGLCEGLPLPRQPFIFVLALAPATPDGAKPPTPDLTVPVLGALPACARAATPGSTTTTAPTGVAPGALPGATPVAGDPRYAG